jgi:hypothetical protein
LLTASRIKAAAQSFRSAMFGKAVHKKPAATQPPKKGKQKEAANGEEDEAEPDADKEEEDAEEADNEEDNKEEADATGGKAKGNAKSKPKQEPKSKAAATPKITTAEKLMSKIIAVATEKSEAEATQKSKAAAKANAKRKAAPAPTSKAEAKKKPKSNAEQGQGDNAELDGAPAYKPNTFNTMRLDFMAKFKLENKDESLSAGEMYKLAQELTKIKAPT